MHDTKDKPNDRIVFSLRTNYDQDGIGSIELISCCPQKAMKYVPGCLKVFMDYLANNPSWSTTSLEIREPHIYCSSDYVGGVIQQVQI